LASALLCRRPHPPAAGLDGRNSEWETGSPCWRHTSGLPGYDAAMGRDFAVRAGTPPDVVSQINLDAPLLVVTGSSRC
jgi:hypothetical protein